MSLNIPSNQDLQEVLDQKAEQMGISSEELAALYIKEGVRMDSHPMVRFVNGPSGRRASVNGSLDVWEIVLILRDNHGSVQETAGYLQIPEKYILAAAAYYAAFPREIDQQIQQNLEAEKVAEREAVKSIGKLLRRPRPWIDELEN